MSNLLKSKYLVFQGEKTRVIDSNELIAQKITKQQDVVNPVAEDTFHDGFNLGIEAERVELLLEDQEEQQEEPEVNSEILVEEIIESANRQAQSIIESANLEAEQIKRMAFKEGKKQGYEEGCCERLLQVESQEKALEERENVLEAEFQERLARLEPELVETIAGIFEAVFKIQFGETKEMVFHLVESALGRITSSKEFIIHAARVDYEYMKSQKEAIMKMVPNANFIEIIEDAALSKNQCMIETDGGVFDCSLDIQIENLIKALKILSYT